MPFNECYVWLFITIFLLLTNKSRVFSSTRHSPKGTSTFHFICSYFSFKPALHDWCNKCRGTCNPVCGMVHIKDPLLLIEKSSPCVGESRILLSLSEWSFTICPTPYNRK